MKGKPFVYIVELHVIVNSTEYSVVHKSVFTMNLCRRKQQNIFSSSRKVPHIFVRF